MSCAIAQVGAEQELRSTGLHRAGCQIYRGSGGKGIIGQMPLDPEFCEHDQPKFFHICKVGQPPLVVKTLL